jgi:hypothetical protein
MFKLIVFMLFVFESQAFLNIKQSYEVHGKLLCGADPLANVQVVLYDLDAGRVLFIFRSQRIFA